MNKRIIALLLTLTAAFSLAACGTNAQPVGSEEGSAVLEASAAPEVFAIIGEELAGEYVYTVKLTNNTGADITAVTVKDGSMESYLANMLPEQEIFADGETRVLYYDAAEAVKAEEAADSDPVRTPEYTVQITLSDGKALELHAFPFGDAESCAIELEGDVAYIVYESLSTKERVKTLEAEQAILDQIAAEAAAAEEAARQAAAAEAARQAAAAAEEAARQAQQQQQTVVAPEEEDGCVDDGLMY